MVGSRDPARAVTAFWLSRFAVAAAQFALLLFMNATMGSDADGAPYIIVASIVGIGVGLSASIRSDAEDAGYTLALGVADARLLMPLVVLGLGFMEAGLSATVASSSAVGLALGLALAYGVRVVMQCRRAEGGR